MTISYSLIDSSPPSQHFNDVIEFNNVASPAEKSKTRVMGVSSNELLEGKSKPGAKDVRYDNGARYQWRGKGSLKVASSKWQVLGFVLSDSPDRARCEESDWVVTYFASTLVST